MQFFQNIGFVFQLLIFWIVGYRKPGSEFGFSGSGSDTLPAVPYILQVKDQLNYEANFETSYPEKGYDEDQGSTDDESAQENEKDGKLHIPGPNSAKQTRTIHSTDRLEKKPISLNMMDTNTGRQRLMSATVTIVVDPHWFQSGSRSGSAKSNQCGSRRIRIFIRLFSHKKLHFYMENILKVDKRSKNVHKKVQQIF